MDSHTIVKGKLENLSVRLIEDYKRILSRPVFRLAVPIFGKPADAHNKKGVVALFARDEEQAISHWQEALF